MQRQEDFNLEVTQRDHIIWYRLPVNIFLYAETCNNLEDYLLIDSMILLKLCVKMLIITMRMI